MAVTKVRIGIVGAGENARTRHIPGFQHLEEVELIAVCNRSLQSGQRVAEQFGIPRVYSRWDQVVNDPDVGAVLIGTWPYMHAQCTCAALRAGKHVLCEARMAMNSREAHEMWSTSRANPQLVAQIVPSPATLAFDRTIQKLIADWYLGEPYVVQIRQLSKEFLNTEGDIHWREDFGLSGYNVLSLGIWYEALMRWLGEATEVVAMSQVFVKHRFDRRRDQRVGVRVPQHVDVIAQMACGAQTQMQFSAATGLADASSAWLFGSQGTLHLDLVERKLYGGRRGDPALRTISIQPAMEDSWRVEEEFVGAIRGEEDVVLTSFEQGVKYMEFTEAVAVSAARGKVVTLPLVCPQ